MHNNENFANAMRYEDGNPAGFDAKERVKVLDEEGIDIAVLYCGLGQALGGIQDPQLAVACHQVWNDWMADWTSAAPDRLVGSAVIPAHDPAAAAAEVHRAAGMGLRAGVVRPNPVLGRPLWSHDFDPMYDALEEDGHPARAARSRPLRHGGNVEADDGPDGVGHAPRRHPLRRPVHDARRTSSTPACSNGTPTCKVAVLECGGGWIAHWMDRMDEFLDSYSWAAAKMSLAPSEYFRRQCVMSFDPGEHTMGAMAASRAPTTSSGRPTSRTATRSIPASSTSCASTPTTWNRPIGRKLFGENAARLYGIEDLVAARVPA